MLFRALHPRSLIFFEGEGGGGGAGGEGGGSGNGSPQTFTQEQVNDFVARERGKLQQKYGDYDALKTKAGELDSIKAASQSDLERTTGEVNSLKGENGSLKSTNLRLKTALKLGFTGDRAELADLLQGSTEAEMEEHGKKLAAMFNGGNGNGGGFDGGARGGGGNQPQTMDQLIRQRSGRIG